MDQNQTLLCPVVVCLWIQNYLKDVPSSNNTAGLVRPSPAACTQIVVPLGVATPSVRLVDLDIWW